jgi:hypothetical protein
VDHRRIDAQRITDFFEHRDWKLETFANVERYDWTGLRGRLESSSAPRAGDANYKPLMRGLRELFDAHKSGGMVDFAYDTNLYYGLL